MEHPAILQHTHRAQAIRISKVARAVSKIKEILNKQHALNLI